MELSYCRTCNYSVLTRMATTPLLWHMQADDFSPEPSAYSVPQHELIWYVLCENAMGPLGFFSFFPESPIMAKLHTVLLPHSWGRSEKGGAALEALRGVFPWMWRNSGFRRIITDVPEFNRLAYHFGLKAGMKEFGFNEASFMKDGKLHGQHLLGLTRPEDF